MDRLLNPFKQALKAGRLQIGLWHSLASHLAVEILADSGFDWILLDTEHAPNELPMVHAQLQAMGGGTAHAVVRAAWNDQVIIKRLLDIGAQSLLIPYVETEEEARRAVMSIRYPPDGFRGVASLTRASRYGRIKGYYEAAHEQICLLLAGGNEARASEPRQDREGGRRRRRVHRAERSFGRAWVSRQTQLTPRSSRRSTIRFAGSRTRASCPEF